MYPASHRTHGQGGWADVDAGGYLDIEEQIYYGNGVHHLGGKTCHDLLAVADGGCSSSRG